MQVGKLSILGDSAQTSTGFFQIASGTTGQRPGSPANSMIRYNQTNTAFEGYANNSWQTFTTGGPYVTSVGLSLPAEFSVTNSPVTGSGTLTGAWATQTVNKFFASPTGSTGTPSFRSIAASDITTVNASAISGQVAIANGGTGAATTSPNLVFAGPTSGTAAGAPAFRSLVAADIPSTLNATYTTTPTPGDSSTLIPTTAFVTGAITTALTSVFLYKGTVDITAAPPSSPGAGWTYKVTTGGTPNVGYTFSPAQTRCDVGDHITYNGTTWDRFEDANPVVTSGTGITVTATGDTSYAVAITNVITAGSAGGAASVPALTYNAQGQITAVTPTAIAIANSAVTWASQTAATFFAAPNASAGVPTFRTIIAADVPTLNQNTTGTASGLSGSQTANFVYAAPDGSAGTAAFRALTATDIPNLAASKITSGQLAIAQGGTGSATTTGNYAFIGPDGSSGAPSFRLLSANDIPSLAASKITSGQLAIAQGGTGAATTSANYFFVGPNGSAGAPSFRAMVAADVPTLNQNTTGTAAGISGSQTANTFFAAPNGSAGTATFRVIVAADLPATAGKTYRTSFTNATLSSGILTVTHNLSNQYVVCFVYDNNNKRIEPDDVTATSTSVTTVDLTSWGTLTGTWNVVILG